VVYTYYKGGRKIMKCLKCKRTWTRTKWYEFISFLSKCKVCGSRWIL